MESQTMVSDPDGFQRNELFRHGASSEHAESIRLDSEHEQIVLMRNLLLLLKRCLLKRKQHKQQAVSLPYKKKCFHEMHAEFSLKEQVLYIDLILMCTSVSNDQNKASYYCS